MPHTGYSSTYHSCAYVQRAALLLFYHISMILTCCKGSGVLSEPRAGESCRLLVWYGKPEHEQAGGHAQCNPFHFMYTFHQVDLSAKEAYCIGLGFALWLRKAGGPLFTKG